MPPNPKAETAPRRGMPSPRRSQGRGSESTVNGVSSKWMFAFGVLPERGPGRPGETVAGFLATAAIFLSAVGLAYRPLRLVPFAILLALLAAAIGGRHARLATWAVYTCAACFVLGMVFAVITSHPLW